MWVSWMIPCCWSQIALLWVKLQCLTRMPHVLDTVIYLFPVNCFLSQLEKENLHNLPWHCGVYKSPAAQVTVFLQKGVVIPSKFLQSCDLSLNITLRLHFKIWMLWNDFQEAGKTYRYTLIYDKWQENVNDWRWIRVELVDFNTNRIAGEKT